MIEHIERIKEALRDIGTIVLLALLRDLSRLVEAVSRQGKH
jgi:hypothetical protein